MEWRCVGASTSRGINSFGLQIRLRTVSFDQLRERLSRNERSKIRKEQKRGQQLVSAPFRSKFHFSPRFSPSVSRFPFPFIRFASDPLSRSNVTSLCRASSTTGSSSPNSPSLRAFHTKYRNMNLVAACAQHGSNYAYAITVIWLTLA